MWTHVRGDPGQGLEEQHLLRWQGRPVCSLKPTGRGQWMASLLELSGISARIHAVSGTAEQAKARSEQLLRTMGWDRDFGSAGSAPRSSEK